MDRIRWDKPGDRTYEMGLDRGVLYPASGVGVPWNGLTSVDENLSDGTTNSYYFDGVKYLDARTPGDFSATVKAFTYPDEFSEYEGFVSPNPGLFFGNQQVTKTFGLSYRTQIGNDLEGPEHGYYIHLAYGLTAEPSGGTYASNGRNATPNEFSWTVVGVPQRMDGIRPTAYARLDSRKLDPDLLAGIEAILYGYTPGVLEEGGDVLDGGSPLTSFTTLELLEVDGGTPYESGLPIIDGGDPNASSADGPPVLGPPGPRLPPITELASIVSSWVPAAS